MLMWRPRIHPRYANDMSKIFDALKLAVMYERLLINKQQFLSLQPNPPIIWGPPLAAWTHYQNDDLLGKNMVQDNYLTFPDLTYNTAVAKVTNFAYHIYNSTGEPLSVLFNRGHCVDELR